MDDFGFARVSSFHAVNESSIEDDIKARHVQDRLFVEACTTAFEDLEEAPQEAFQDTAEVKEYLRGRGAPVPGEATAEYLAQYLMRAVEQMEAKYMFLLKAVGTASTTLSMLRGSLRGVRDEVDRCASDFNKFHEAAYKKCPLARVGQKMQKAVRTLAATTRFKISPFRHRRNKLLTDVAGDEDVKEWLQGSMEHRTSCANLCVPSSPTGSRSSLEASANRSDLMSQLGEPRGKGCPPYREQAKVAATLEGTVGGEMYGTIAEWGFDQRVWVGEGGVGSGRVLREVGVAVMASYSFWDGLGLSVAQVGRFMQEVSDGYHDNPYHCCEHAADVLQTLHSLLANSDLPDYLSDVELFALLLAAVCHDYGHPGIDNQCLDALDSSFVKVCKRLSSPLIRSVV